MPNVLNAISKTDWIHQDTIAVLISFEWALQFLNEHICVKSFGIYL